MKNRYYLIILFITLCAFDLFGESEISVNSGIGVHSGIINLLINDESRLNPKTNTIPYGLASELDITNRDLHDMGVIVSVSSEIEIWKRLSVGAKILGNVNFGIGPESLFASLHISIATK